MRPHGGPLGDGSRDGGPLGDGPRGGRGGGRRMRRGRVPELLLAALLDGPAHGYELIGRLEQLSGGRWRPSPGSVYPLLQAFEDEGLVRAGEGEGRRVFSLTDAGRERANERRVEAAATFPLDEKHLELRDEMFQLRSALRQVASSANTKQTAAAVEIVRGARQALYHLLAE